MHILNAILYKNLSVDVLGCSCDQSQILLYLVKKFTPQTVSILKTEPNILELFQQLLTLSKPLFTGHTSPQEAILNQVIVC